MSHIPKSDPELPIDPPSETAAEQSRSPSRTVAARYRAARFEDVMCCLVSLKELIEAIATTNDGDIGRQHAALMNVGSLRRAMVTWRDGR